MCGLSVYYIMYGFCNGMSDRHWALFASNRNYKRNSSKKLWTTVTMQSCVCYVLLFLARPLPVMPGSCCVPMCKSAIGGHCFPVDRTLRQLWIVAIHGVDSSSQHLMPSPHSVVCYKHFKESDYREILLGWTVILSQNSHNYKMTLICIATFKVLDIGAEQNEIT